MSPNHREVTKKDARFQWKDEHNQTFQKVKELLTSDTVVAYFNKTKQSELTADASPFGLSAILSQHTPGCDDWWIVAYVSRSLTPVEQRYSQTEREVLVIVWAVERLHTCLVDTSNSTPIVSQLSWSSTMPSPDHLHASRDGTCLQEYHFTTVHTKGQNNPSDILSRHPTGVLIWRCGTTFGARATYSGAMHEISGARPW